MKDKLRRFQPPEIILHWFQGVPFLVLLVTGGMMLASRFYNMDLETFIILKTTHKTAAIVWVSLTLFAYLLIGPKLHFSNLKETLTFGVSDIKWLLLSIRCLFDSNVEVPESGKFNTGQKINSILVIIYFICFSITGFLMWFQGTILVSWYLHASLFFAAVSSVGGHLYLSFINPSTRIGLGGVFHGWVPREYIEHHHSLMLSNGDKKEQVQATLGYTKQQRNGLAAYHKKAVGSYMKAEIIFLIITLILGGVGLWVFAHGQKASLKKGFNNIIRPRELSGAHNLKGLAGNCTKCHGYTGELKDEKCLSCHKAILIKMQNKSGFHGTFHDRPCRDCHKEHPKTRGASIIPFEIKKFDHGLALFKLEGKHADKKIQCDACHKKKRKKDYLGIYFVGLKFDVCSDCHTDPHKSQLGKACEKCHNLNGWQDENLNFDHNRDSQYKLEGKHAKAKCIGCHAPAKKNAPLGTAVFRGLKIKCANCHNDPHRSQFGEYCQSCHSITTWKGKELRFDHNLDSKYRLKGKHAEAKCIACHKPAKKGDPLSTAKFRGLSSDCVTCHKDPHKGNLGSNCSTCHNFIEWKGKNLNFDHGFDSKYRLKGMHKKVKCKQCHIPAEKGAPLATAIFKGLKTACLDCHKDPHKNQFGKNCEKCHTVNGWQGNQLNFDHDKDAKYPLEGKHEKVACNKCHVPREKNILGSAVFIDIKSAQCDDCHKDPHKGEYGKECLPCHSVQGFPPKEYKFDHYYHTKYELEGLHQRVKCLDCHNQQRVKSLGKESLQQFKDNCGLCHEDFHLGQLGTDCKKCHSPYGWKGKDNLLFIHNLHSRYKIDNIHFKVKCKQCHKKNHYKPLGTDCESCHPQGQISVKPR